MSALPDETWAAEPLDTVAELAYLDRIHHHNDEHAVPSTNGNGRMSAVAVRSADDDIDVWTPTPRTVATQQQPAEIKTALSVRRLADIEMRSIEWLDKPLFQRAAFHLVAGKKGAGKGTYLAGLASRVSRGEIFNRPMNVLLIASEDSDEIDIKPRVVAAGGDVDRIYSVNGPLTLPAGVAALEQTARDISDVGLILLDPVASHVRGDTHAEDPVRYAIDPLNKLAHDLDCLLIGVRHLGKNTQAGALASVLGSTAWVNVPRAVLAVAADDEEELLFHIAVVAGNRSARGNGRSFRIELADIGLKEPVTRAVDAGDSAKSIDDLLGQTVEERRTAAKRDGAAEVILRELARCSSQPLDYLKAKCIAEVGCSGETAYRAANALKAAGKVGTRNSGPGTPWVWFLTLPPDSSTLSYYEVTDSVTKSGDDSVTLPSHTSPEDVDEVTPQTLIPLTGVEPC
jgi:putative DNA primase/helicase